MDISGRLPMNPWLFIVFYIGLVSVGALTSAQPMEWAMLGSVLALGLHLAWIVQAGLYSFRKADEKLGPDALRVKHRRVFAGAAVATIASFLILILGFLFLWAPDPVTGSVRNDPIAVAFVLALFCRFHSHFSGGENSMPS